MSRILGLSIWMLACWLAGLSCAHAQTGPYIGYVYPAGGQQGTTFQVKLGGQRLEEVEQVLVTGQGISAELVEYFRPLGAQEMTLVREQLNELRRSTRGGRTAQPDAQPGAEGQRVLAAIDKRAAEYCNRPASVSISSLAFVQVRIAPDAQPGRREIRLVTPRGVTNPLAFHVGQLPEVARKPMRTSDLQVLGKEELALRKRPPEEVEQQISLPCTVNGQVASGEVNWYRFEARRGQRLVFTTAARQLIPYIADAVPGWFQPVLAVYDAAGKELAYNDDYRFKPDPTLLFEVPEDGEYRFTVADAIYRGREDFVYRVTVGELPFVTSLFPLGGPVGAAHALEMQGWNLEAAELAPPPAEAPAGVHWLAAIGEGYLSNVVPFALDTLPECLEREANDAASAAQPVPLPIVINGRVDRPNDWDVFQITGRAGQTLVAEVSARRLDSPLDSMLKLTDADGNLIAFNDDHEDAASGLNTHHADSYLSLELPADGKYFVHLGDTARSGGPEYAYRLRLSPPRPDFELRVVPSSVVLRNRASAPLTVYAIRKDGFAGDIRLSLKNPPPGLSSLPARLMLSQESARLTVNSGRGTSQKPLLLTIEGRAEVEGAEVAREAVPAEDRMQAFLWRHLVPAESLPAVLGSFNSSTGARRADPSPEVLKKASAAYRKQPQTPVQFTQQQVAGRVRQLKAMYQDWLLTEDFYARKLAECEAVQ